MDAAVSRRFALVPLVVLLAGCNVSVGNLTGRAVEEWTHTYPLTAGGEVRIVNTNGRIEVEGVDGASVEVRAERIARGATEAAARELLPRIVIKEDAGPDRVSVETEKIGGLLIGVGFEVRYHVKAPKGAVVNVTNTNGQVVLTGLSGKVNAHTTNGGVKGDGLTGGIQARSTNGSVSIDMASVGKDPVSLTTTNGAVLLTLPDNAKADLTASCTNGGISVGEFQSLDVVEKSRRRLEGKLNGGGTQVELQTTNGGVRIRPRNSVGDKQTNDDRKDR